MRIIPRRISTVSSSVVLTVTLSLTLSLASTSRAGAAPSPINPDNRPTALAGAVNGVVPMSRLVNVAANCTAAREAGPSLARIFAMAREINDALGADQCYRPLSDEVKFANQAEPAGQQPRVRRDGRDRGQRHARRPLVPRLGQGGRPDRRGPVVDVREPRLRVHEAERGIARLEPSRVRGAGRELVPRTVALGVGR